MKVVIQRVKHASVTVNGIKISEIKHGILLLLGVAENDTPEDIVWLSKDRKSTRLNSSHITISYAVFCLKKKIKRTGQTRHYQNTREHR